MDFLIQHWDQIALFLIIVIGCVVSSLRFSKLTKAERYEQIRGWLLQAVILAEKQFGSKTGRLKLSNVYAEFCKQLPWIAQIISFQTFSEYVDDALEEMRDILSGNNAIMSVIESKGENNN